MSAPITITPQEIVNLVLAICGAIITISGAGTIIIRAIAKVKEPNKMQDERLDKIENDIAQLKERFKDETHNLFLQQEAMNKIETTQKETNVIIIKSLQAIIDYTLDGNNTDKLKHSKEQLAEYLIDKAV